MRRHVIPILILFALVCAAVFFVLNSSWFLLQAIPPSVAGYLKPREFQSLQIGQQRYRFPSTLVLSDVKFSLEEGFLQTDFSLDKLVIYNFLDIIKKQRKIRADVIGLKMEGQNIRINDVDLKLSLMANENSVITRGQGMAKGGSVSFDSYQVQELSGRINIDRKKIEFLDIAAKAYGGDVKGQILFDRGVTFPSYIIWAELAHWQPEKLQEINPGLFSQLRGEFNGTFRMKNDNGRVQFFTAEFAWPKGGEMTSQMIKKIFSGDSANKEALDLIIAGKTKVFFDSGKFYVQNTGLTKMMLGVELEKKEGDFNIRTLHEVDTPEGIEPFLFQYIKTDPFTKAE